MPSTFFYDGSGTTYNVPYANVMAFQANAAGSAWGITRNGTLESDLSGISAPNTTATGFVLANDPNFSRILNCTIHEFILLERTDQQTRLKMEGYLAWKWGLASYLPQSHPYRFTAPKDNRYLKRKTRTLVALAGSSGSGGTTHNSTLSESVTAADAMSAIATFAALASEAITAGDAASSTATFNSTATESITASDTFGGAATFAALISESTTLADLVDSGNLFLVTLSEAVTVADAQAAAATYVGAINEIVGMADAQAVTAQFAAAISEATTISDVAQAAALYGLALSEGIALGESATASRILIATLAESLGLADLLTSGSIALIRLGGGRLHITPDVRSCVVADMRSIVIP